jgi:V/A-type H+-transporting ATPase subunit F
MKDKIAVVGEKDSVMPFNAVGIEVRPASEAGEVEKAIHALAREGYPVIYITEAAALQAEAAIAFYAGEPFPAIIPIPDAGGSKGLGRRSVSKNVEKAMGADILFGEGR